MTTSYHLSLSCRITRLRFPRFDRPVTVPQWAQVRVQFPAAFSPGITWIRVLEHRPDRAPLVPRSPEDDLLDF